MSGAQNRQVILAQRPVGIPQASDFAVIDAPIPEIGVGEILIRNQFLSVEPAMRGWLATGPGYLTPIGLGEVMRSFATGTIIQSRHPDYREGEDVTGMFGWQHYAAVTPSAITRKVIETDLPLSLSLGVLGLNGVTAYLGLLTAGEPRAGETVSVSTAAGGVGSLVGQIAKILGCRTIGITGGPEKVGLCRDVFGYDAAIDYKADDLDAMLREYAPNGINVYFDNTAGTISDIVIRHIANHARIIICGTASIERWDPPPMGPRVERQILLKRARIQGYLTLDHTDRYEAAIAQLAAWLRAGKLSYREDILDGIESCPDSIAGLYRGENMGKRLIRL